MAVIHRAIEISLPLWFLLVLPSVGSYYKVISGEMVAKARQAMVIRTFAVTQGSSFPSLTDSSNFLVSKLIDNSTSASEIAQDSP